MLKKEPGLWKSFVACMHLLLMLDMAWSARQDLDVLHLGDGMQMGLSSWQDPFKCMQVRSKLASNALQKDEMAGHQKWKSCWCKMWLLKKIPSYIEVVVEVVAVWVAVVVVSEAVVVVVVLKVLEIVVVIVTVVVRRSAEKNVVLLQKVSSRWAAGLASGNKWEPGSGRSSRSKSSPMPSGWQVNVPEWGGNQFRSWEKM